MADTGVDKEKIARLAAMAEASRLGGKGSIRRKHAPVHKTSSAQDDKRLQQVLKRLNMNVVPGIDEVNLFKDDDTVIHFSNPKVQMSNGTNTFVVSGTAETKNIHDIAPSILKQLNQEQLAKLIAQQQQSGDMPGLVSDE